MSARTPESLNVKNVYAEFKIPNTPLAARVGVQGVALLDSWIIDTDVSGGLIIADLKPVTLILGYVAGQNYITTTEDENIDDLAGAVIYKQGGFTAGLVGLWQDAHNTPASVFPTLAAAFDDPLQVSVPASTAIPNPYQYMVVNGAVANVPQVLAQQNDLIDVGLQLGYKNDFLSVYLNAVKNFGSVQLGPNVNTLFNADYKGWMVDAGANWFCGPFTLNGGGFYTSGSELTLVTKNGGLPSSTNPQIIASNLDIDGFTYPLTHLEVLLGNHRWRYLG